MSEDKKRFTIEEKILYLEKLTDSGIDVNCIPNDYISDDNVIASNVITNLKKAFDKDTLTFEQILRCEAIGIKFDTSLWNTDKEIVFLKKALDEGINIYEYTDYDQFNYSSSIHSFISDIREKYEDEKLDKSQIDTCTNYLKILIPKDDRKAIINQKVRDIALKNVVFFDEIDTIFSEK